jgi:peroxiredoxin
MKKILTSLALISVFAFGAGSTTATPNNKVTQNREIPKFTLEDVAGNKIEIEQTNSGLKYKNFKNKNVILFFYLYSGAPCQGELETFKKVAKDKKDLEIVTIELKGLDKKALAEYAKKKDLNFHMITGKSAKNFVNYIAYRAKWKGTVPFIIITDKKGAVQHIQIGAMNKEQLNSILSKLN